MRMSPTFDLFDLSGKVFVITGGAGLLGLKHAEAIIEANGIPILLDVNPRGLSQAKERLSTTHNFDISVFCVDITQPQSVKDAFLDIISSGVTIYGLINNAARDPKVSINSPSNRLERFETMTLETWHQDLDVSLTGSFICSQIFGTHMSQNKQGVILNIASDLALIAPDQRLYAQAGVPPQQQPVKPVTYSVAKTGLLGLTRYLSTYWATSGVRVNSVSPGGVEADQSSDFLQRVSNLIPLGRLAKQDEYKATIVYLLSDASSYMTGANLVIDGGRSVW